jgi:cytochrome c
MSPLSYAIPAALGIMTCITSVPASAEMAKPPKAIRLCIACHTFNKGEPAKIGPNLYGIYGKNAASNPSYTKYGDSMKQAGQQGVVWDDQTLDAYMKNPIKFLKNSTGEKRVKTSMITRAQKAEDRAAIINYLKTLKD